MATPEEAAQTFYASESAALVLGVMTSVANDFAARVRPYNPAVAEWLAKQGAAYGAIGAQPEVVASSPEDGAVGIPLASNVSVTFQYRIDPASVTPDVFSLGPESGGTVEVALSLSEDGQTVLFDTAEDLAPSTWHRITVASAVANEVGFVMAEDFTSRFETAGA